MIGFIGTGTIGKPMAHQLITHGHGLMVFDLDNAATQSLVDAGAVRAASVAEVAAECETVFLSLPGPPQIEAVLTNDDGLLANVGELSTIIDLSTNAVALNRRLAAQALQVGVDYLDAPVSGGRVAAEKGTLAVMVGGRQAAFERVEALIKCFGENIFYLGPPASGTLAKLVNNQIFLCASVLIQEGFVMGASAGMDSDTLHDVLKVSSAGSLLARAPMLLSRKFDLDVFALAIAAKDVGVALESAEELGASMPMTKAAHGVYAEALEAGLGDEDFYATIKVLEQAAQAEVAPLSKPKKPAS